MRQLCIFVLLAFVIASCSKKGSDINQEDDLEKYLGHVTVFDEYDNLLKDWSGVNVAIENSNPLISVVTNEKGSFLLPKLDNTKNLVVVYSKPGFGTYKEYLAPSRIDSINSGKDRLGYTMKAASNVIVNSLTATVKEDTVKMNVNVSFPQSSGLKYVRFIMSTNANVGLNDIVSIPKNLSRTFKVTNGANAITFCRSCMKACGFKSGDTVHLKAYGSTDLLDGYQDQITNNYVLASLNPDSKSAVVSFVVP